VIVPFRNPIWVQFMFHKVLRLLTPWFVLGIGVWAAWSLGGRLDSLALAVCAGLAALTGLWLAVSGGRVGSRLRRIIVEALLIQVAVLVAGFNGLRGHWRVWDA
jgi:uncharacterized membrane protein